MQLDADQLDGLLTIGVVVIAAIIVLGAVTLAVALGARFASFYLPPLWGWFCSRWLVARRYL